MLDGTLALDRGALLRFQGTQALDGTGRVDFGALASTSGTTTVLNRVWVTGGTAADPATLTIGPGVTVAGRRGEIGDGFATSFDRFVNRGTLAADVAGGLITVRPDRLVDEGIIRAADGGMSASPPTWPIMRPAR